MFDYHFPSNFRWYHPSRDPEIDTSTPHSSRVKPDPVRAKVPVFVENVFLLFSLIILVFVQSGIISVAIDLVTINILNSLLS